MVAPVATRVRAERTAGVRVDPHRLGRFSPLSRASDLSVPEPASGRPSGLMHLRSGSRSAALLLCDDAGESGRALAEDRDRRQFQAASVLAGPAAAARSGSLGRRNGAIAFDGERSCEARPGRDRFARNRIAPRQPPRPSFQPRAGTCRAIAKATFRSSRASSTAATVGDERSRSTPRRCRPAAARASRSQPPRQLAAAASPWPPPSVSSASGSWCSRRHART